jgi:predicted lipoprotein with Yx(FWY)xxD motif
MMVYAKNHRTTEGRSMKRILIFVGAALAVALTVAACGSRASASTTTTVATRQVAGATVLVTAAGLPLYTNNQDSAAMVQCTGACATVWRPLTIASGSPTGTSAAGSLGVVALSDGMRQVTVNGKPVYTFVVDRAGKVSGNDARDQFGGKKFTWRVVTTSGTPGSSGGSGTSSGNRY